MLAIRRDLTLLMIGELKNVLPQKTHILVMITNKPDKNILFLTVNRIKNPVGFGWRELIKTLDFLDNVVMFS
jgi:hypothetical protein